MISQEHWRQLGGLYFAARRAVEGLWAGRHVSSRLGSGLEFHDYRPYTPGDALANVDWKLFGRTDRHYVRRFEQLTDLNAYVMLDVSASMNFAGFDAAGQPLSTTAQPTKLAFAATLASAIGFLTIRQSDRIGLGLYADRLLDHLRPSGSMAALKRFCNTIEHEALEPTQRETDLASSLVAAHAMLRRRGLLVVIGDLLEDVEPVFDALGRFLHDRFDVIVLQVLTPTELDLRDVGLRQGRVVDAETGDSLRTFLPTVQQRYRARVAEHLRAIRLGCVARGIDYNLLTTDQHVVEALRRYLVRRTAASV